MHYTLFDERDITEFVPVTVNVSLADVAKRYACTEAEAEQYVGDFIETQHCLGELVANELGTLKTKKQWYNHDGKSFYKANTLYYVRKIVQSMTGEEVAK